MVLVTLLEAGALLLEAGVLLVVFLTLMTLKVMGHALALRATPPSLTCHTTRYCSAQDVDGDGIMRVMHVKMGM